MMIQEIKDIEVAHIKSALCIDYGTKKMGIALSPDMKLSLPIDVFHENSREARIIFVNNAVKKYNPSILIIGLPLNMDGTESDQSTLTRKFANDLDQSVPIYMQDERVTSMASVRLMQSVGFSSKQINKHEDSLAASMILESFIRNLAFV